MSGKPERLDSSSDGYWESSIEYGNENWEDGYKDRNEWRKRENIEEELQRLDTENAVLTEPLIDRSDTRVSVGVLKNEYGSVKDVQDEIGIKIVPESDEVRTTNRLYNHLQRAGIDEIQYDEHKQYKKAWAAPDLLLSEEDIAIECKGGSITKKAVGQAAIYMTLGFESYIAVDRQTVDELYTDTLERIGVGLILVGVNESEVWEPGDGRGVIP